jgi:AraC family transcriptional regulator, regulatory protein of adaptative response / DNA-3-methyladenine glycosylase II
MKLDQRTKALFQCDLSLPYRPPFDWTRMLDFFQVRAIPGVEWVDGGAYHRTIRLGETAGTICVRHAAQEQALLLTTALSDSRDLMAFVDRVRRMFDLDANMAAIHAVLATDPALKKIIDKHPGLRLPGAWDPFEVAVRAVVGQQISVKGARTVIGRIAARAGSPCAFPTHPQLAYFFPTAKELSVCKLEGIGMPAKRIETIRALSRAAAGGELALVGNAPTDEFVAQLTRIPGIGDWTAHYIAMRALGDPDAFPAADLGILKALQQGDMRPTPRQVWKRAENWRPWRAYAAVYLWHK